MEVIGSFNFRKTEAHVSDRAGDTFVIGSVFSDANSDTYPTTRDGHTFGFYNYSIAGGRYPRAAGNRAGITYSPFAGYCAIEAPGNATYADAFVIDLPAAGEYGFRVYSGREAGTIRSKFHVCDGLNGPAVWVNDDENISTPGNQLVDGTRIDIPTQDSELDGRFGVANFTSGQFVLQGVSSGTTAFQHIEIIDLASGSGGSAADQVHVGRITSGGV